MSQMALGIALLVLLGHHQAVPHAAESTHVGAKECRHLDGIALTPGRTRMGQRVDRSRILLEPTRARIHRLLREGHGLTVSRLAQHLGLNNSSVSWHLQKLVAAGLIVADLEGPTPHYKEAPGLHTSLAEAVRQVHCVPARELLEVVQRHPGQHLGDLAARIAAPRSRYWRVVRPLLDAGLLRSTPDGRRQRLFITDLARDALRQTARDRVLASPRRRIRRT